MPKRVSVAHAGAAEALKQAVTMDGKTDYRMEGGHLRRLTELEKQVIAMDVVAEDIVDALPEQPRLKVDLYLPDILNDALFVGHLVTDLDSVAGAIGAADLYGGTPTIASKVNSETAFALEKWGCETPKAIEEMIKANPTCGICLVDHQQTSQMNPAIDVDRIVGVIDHHALQSKTIVTDKPIYIDIRPWGSMSTILAHTFLTHGRRPPKKVAGMLLCAILSDTLNLLGPTTTDWDRLMVAVLAEICDVEDIQTLATEQFKAKSKELATLSAVGLVNGDQKSFSFDAPGFQGDVGFGVVETTDDDVIMDRVEELLPELVACKKEKGYACLFLAVVNIVKLRSCLLICGLTELALARDAFGGELSREDTVMDLGNRVSMKKDYIPVITKTIKGGWSRPSDLRRGPSAVDLTQLGTLEVDPTDPYGRVSRRGSVLEPKKSTRFSLYSPGEAEKKNVAAPIKEEAEDTSTRLEEQVQSYEKEIEKLKQAAADAAERWKKERERLVRKHKDESEELKKDHEEKMKLLRFKLS